MYSRGMKPSLPRVRGARVLLGAIAIAVVAAAGVGCGPRAADPSLATKIDALETSQRRLSQQVSNLTALAELSRNERELRDTLLAAIGDDVRRLQQNISDATRLHTLHEQAIDTLATGSTELADRLDAAVQMITEVNDSVAGLQQSLR